MKALYSAGIGLSPDDDVRFHCRKGRISTAGPTPVSEPRMAVIVRICNILYTDPVDIPPRKVKFRGSSRADLRRFPQDARREAGQQLFRVQLGMDPKNWKPMETVGAGVREIRIRDESGIYRVMYVAKFAEAIYVLHCFQKKTKKTAPNELALAERRYKELARELAQ